MRVAIGSDHAGYIIKDAVISAIKEAGHDVIDFGTTNFDRVDYPDYAEKVGKAVKPTDLEVGDNIRSRSAVMRVAERVA